MDKVNIGVLEDEGIVAMDLKRSLVSLGYDVAFVVDSAEKALELLNKDKVDIILMDIMLKGSLNGIEAAKIIKQIYHIPILFLTAFEDEETLAKAVEVSSYGYLIKPFDNRGLNDFIMKAIIPN